MRNRLIQISQLKHLSTTLHPNTPPINSILTASNRLSHLQRHLSDMGTIKKAPTTVRLADLRSLMKSKHVDIYGIPAS